MTKGDFEPPPQDAVYEVLFGGGKWISMSESDTVEIGRQAHIAGNELANLVAEGKGIGPAYRQLAIGKIFQGPGDAADNAVHTIEVAKECFHLVGKTCEQNGPTIQAGKEYDYQRYIDTKTQWDALQKAKQSPLNKEYWFDDTSLEEFAQPAKQAIDKNHQTKAGEINTRRTQAAADPAATPPEASDNVPGTDGVPTPTTHVSETRARTSSPTGPTYSYSPASVENQLSSGSSPDGFDGGTGSLGNSPTQADSPMDQGMPSPAAAQTPQGPSAATPSPAGGSARPDASAATSAMSAAAPVAPSGFGDMKGPAGDGAASRSGFASPPGMPGGVGSLAQPGAPAPGSQARPPVVSVPSTTNVSAPSSQPQATQGQGAGLSGGGGRGAAPAGVNAQPAAKAAPTAPMAGAAPEAPKQETAGALAAKERKEYSFLSGVVEGEDHILGILLGALRLAAKQVLDHWTDERRKMLGIDISIAALRLPDSTMDFKMQIVGPGGGMNYLHRDFFYDPTVGFFATSGKNPLNLLPWVRAAKDPNAVIVAGHKTLVMEAQAHEESPPLLTHLVTTRATTCGEDVQRHLKQHGTVFVQDVPDVGVLAEVKVPPFLLHRINQLGPDYAWITKLNNLPRDQALEFGLALAQDAITRNKVAGDDNSPLQAIVDHLGRGEKIPEQTKDAAFSFYSGRLSTAKSHMVDGEPSASEEPVINWGGPSDDSPEKIDTIALHAKAFYQAVTASLVLQLGRFSNPVDPVGNILGDLSYEFHLSGGGSGALLEQHLASLPKPSEAQ